MKSIVVTGASTGIGWGCVKFLIGKGFHVFGSVRKQTDAERLQKEFGAAFTPLIFDVTDEAAVAAGAKIVAAKLNGEQGSVVAQAPFLSDQDIEAAVAAIQADNLNH